MSGLNLRARGGVNASVGLPNRPNTASDAAFGSYTDSGTPSTINAITPNDPFGIAFFWGIAGLGVLLLIRHSLPQ